MGDPDLYRSRDIPTVIQQSNPRKSPGPVRARRKQLFQTEWIDF
jgi:hypothetical protein